MIQFGAFISLGNLAYLLNIHLVYMLSPRRCRFFEFEVFNCQTFGRWLAVLGLFLLLSNLASAKAVICNRAQSSSFENIQTKAVTSFLLEYGIDRSQPYPQYSRIKSPVNGFMLVSEIGNDEQTIYEFNPQLKQGDVYIPKEISPYRTIVKKSTLKNFQPPEKNLQRQANNDYTIQNFTLTDIGFKHLTRDYPILTDAFEQAILKRPHNSFQIEFHPDLFNASLYLRNFHQWASLTVTDIYEKRKGYLSPSDLYALRDSDLSAESMDNYFVLQKSTPHSIGQQTYEQFREHTLAIIRLVRNGKGNFFIPDKFDNGIGNLNLPILQRYRDTKVGDQLKQAFYELSIFGRKEIAEISRFVRTQDFPDSLLNSLLKNVFEAAVAGEKKIDVITISVDAVTRRLFKKYRFKDLAPLTDPEKETSEFIMYIDTNTGEFKQTLNELRQKSTEVQESAFDFKQGIPQKTKYTEPPGWYRGSDREVFEYAFKRRMELLKQANNNRPLKPLVWNQPWLSNTKRGKDVNALELIEKLKTFPITPAGMNFLAINPSSARNNLFRRTLWSSSYFGNIAIGSVIRTSRKSSTLVISANAEALRENQIEQFQSEETHWGDLNFSAADIKKPIDQLVFDWTSFPLLSTEEVKGKLFELLDKVAEKGVVQIYVPPEKISYSDLSYMIEKIIDTNPTISEAEIGLTIAGLLSVERSQHYQSPNVNSLVTELNELFKQSAIRFGISVIYPTGIDYYSY